MCDIALLRVLFTVLKAAIMIDIRRHFGSGGNWSLSLRVVASNFPRVMPNSQPSRCGKPWRRKWGLEAALLATARLPGMRPKRWWYGNFRAPPRGQLSSSSSRKWPEPVLPWLLGWAPVSWWIIPGPIEKDQVCHKRPVLRNRALWKRGFRWLSWWPAFAVLFQSEPYNEIIPDPN